LTVRLAGAQATFTQVTVDQAKAMIDSNPSLVILDVRNESEYDAYHLRNALLIPVWNLTQNLGELNKNDTILVYCRSGARSANASGILVSNGFLYVYDMLEGINQWIAEGFPVFVMYPSIQAAIENATDGQTIYVSSGLYSESLIVDKPITLVGENASTTEINASTSVLNVQVDNVSISDFTVRYTGCTCYGYSSVNVTNSHNVNVTDNTIISDDYGIRVAASTAVIVADDDVGQVGDASLVVSNSSAVLVFGNHLTGNLDGVEIDNGNDSTFWNNTVMAQLTGIFMAESFGNMFFNNNIFSATQIGLSFSSDYNNTFFDNDVHSASEYALFLWQTSANSFFHNNFLQNSYVQIYSNDNSTDSFDNSIEGNYWCNYIGVDSNHDGISDTPYVMDSTMYHRLVDNFPLMSPIFSFNTSLGIEVNVISNSSVDDFNYLPSNNTITFQVSNKLADQTVGFCRISIPHSLINPVNGTISVAIDNGQVPVLFINSTVYDDGFNRWIYFTYPLTTHSVTISTVPEFPTLVILALFMAITIFATAVQKRRRASL
jgi:parallel beta-helix repeat protein